jgi:hypothetical protein
MSEHEQIEASLIGGYYGRVLHASSKEKNIMQHSKNPNFVLKKKTGIYQITMRNRQGEIGYFNRLSRKEFIEHPLAIINHKHIISNFDPSQACYIGMLAALSLTKQINKGEIFDKPPKLRAVN